jgi:hypothetical protein
LTIKTLHNIYLFLAGCFEQYAIYIVDQSEEVCCSPENDAAVRLRQVVFVSKIQRFYIQITVQTGWGEGSEERGATPLTCCVG